MVDDLIEQMREMFQVTNVVISHDMTSAFRIAHRAYLLAGGRVVAQGTPADVMRGDVLERVNEWPLVVTRDPAVGAPALVPLRAPPRG
jgi:iron complex transport system ATP-binding protein